MRIFNTQVYGLEMSIIRSGYPMKDSIPSLSEWDIEHKDIVRATKLANCVPGAGHDSFLKGIIVQCDITAPTYWWPQWMRYHFQDTISSQSKMHKASKLSYGDFLNRFSKVDDPALPFYFGEYLDRLYQDISEGRLTLEQYLMMLPMGFEYTAGVTTNYLQLKSMYNQRKYHKLSMWSYEFVNWVQDLPYPDFIIGGAM